MNKKGLWVFAFFLFLLLCAAVYYLMQPVVIYVESPLPEEYLNRLSKPSYVSLKYRLIVSNEEELLKDYVSFKPDLIIFSPLTEKPDYVSCKTAGWGFAERDSFDILISNNVGKMFSTALSKVWNVSTAFLYREGCSEAEAILQELEGIDEFVYGLSYKDRISDANRSILLEELEANGTVNILMHEPSTAYSLLTTNTGITCYADFRDVAALYSPDKLVSIHPDWAKAISVALSEESDFSFDYTFGSSKNFIEVLKNIFL